jgi:glucokinase
MYLGVEIGGTKLQLGVGDGAGRIVALERFAVERERGAEGIRERIAAAGRALIEQYGVQRVGFGFGGPIDRARGMIVKSHHVDGWDGFPLVAWCRQELGLPAVIENDCDAASLAEAQFGAGRGRDPVFYVTVGTGIGGGLVTGGQIYRGSGHGAAEIGHLRPGLECSDPHAIVEALASGWGIADQARQRIQKAADGAAELTERCGGDLARLTTQQVAEAAAAGNSLAQEVLATACRALGWAIAQALTLTSPEVIVVGGGVSLAGEELFFAPLRCAVQQYVFPPLAGKFRIVPAELGEEVVVHGALATARCG